MCVGVDKEKEADREGDINIQIGFGWVWVEGWQDFLDSAKFANISLVQLSSRPQRLPTDPQPY